MTHHRPHPASPLLDHCPPTLPAEAYSDPAWFARERAAIWAREWVCAGRLDDFAPGTQRALDLAGAPVLLCRHADGSVSAFHNTCRHRGSELCAAGAPRPLGRLIACPYHAWAYEARTGRLVSTAFATPAADFRRADHGLRPVAHRLWNGFLFLSLAADPGPLEPDAGLAALDNWPMETLVAGHSVTRDLACNWKVFWENYNECLHCPGIHPGLCEMVPQYGRGIMSQPEEPGWTPADPPRPNLRPGALTWTPDGQPCGPVFPGLTAAERAAGHTFVTLYPTMYIVAHVDHVRFVTLAPDGPLRTRLTATWLFPPETLAQPGFDAAHVAAFATRVIDEDGAAAEMNQRGLASPGYGRGTLMPQEYDIARFHRWVMARLEERAPA